MLRSIFTNCLKLKQFYCYSFLLLASFEVSSTNLGSPEFYISESILLNEGTPRLNFEKNSKLNWFEDVSTLTSRRRSELGVKNLVPGYTLAYRDQTLHGVHDGRGATFSCILAFCSWIDTSIIDELDRSDKVDYKINSQQLWLEKPFENSDYSLGLIAGINIVDVKLNISNASQRYFRENTFPVPFLGVSAKRKFRDRFYIAYNIHYFEAKKDDLKFSFHDSEIEMGFDIAKNLRAAIGNNFVYFYLQKRNPNLSAEILSPQSSPYLKITLIY